MVFKHVRFLPTAAAIVAVVVAMSGCSSEETAFTTDLNVASTIDAAVLKTATNDKPQTHTVALPGGLIALIAATSARGADGALYVTSAKVSVEETQGWTLDVGGASRPLNVGSGTGKEAVMQTSFLITQSKTTATGMTSRGTMVNVRADGQVSIE